MPTAIALAMNKTVYLYRSIQSIPSFFFLSIMSITQNVPNIAYQLVHLIIINEAWLSTLVITRVWIVNIKKALTTSMIKNVAAQNGAPGSFSTTSGYVRNTRPGPLLTTLATSVCCSQAMFPKIEKVTMPASSDVNVLTTQVIMASLKNKIITLNFNTDNKNIGSVFKFYKEYVYHD